MYVKDILIHITLYDKKDIVLCRNEKKAMSVQTDGQMKSELIIYS